MHVSLNHVAGILIMIVVVLLLAAGAAGDDAVQVQILEDSPDRIVIHYQLVEPQLSKATVGTETFMQPLLAGASMTHTKGAPAVPKISRSIIIPDDAAMGVRVLSSRHHDITDVSVLPAKGPILRTVDPQQVPYTFGDVYRQDAEYPGTVAELGTPYILRDHRGLVLTLYPVQHNPLRKTLRVYTDVVLEVRPTGPGQINVRVPRPGGELLLKPFHDLYSRHFLNHAHNAAYPVMDEHGDMVIIVHDPWIELMEPLAAHRTAGGIDATIVGVSTIPGGNTSTAIKAYVQEVFDSSDLAFVLLVGDAAQVATPHSGGGTADPTYALLAGTDSYPDIFVGRFSAQTKAHVQTQVWRTIAYEQMPAIDQDWFWRGTGIASNQGPGDDNEYDNQHMNNIRLDLLDNGYTEVDQIYDPSASASQVSAALNAGRGIINYCGHGSQTSWSSSGFSVSHINALVNDDMLPFIFSVACVNGDFEISTCFAEAWLRATHNDAPTGAIGIYASSINQYWDEPMCAQDEIIDQMVAESYVTIGALAFAGSCQMMDEYGSSGVDMYNTWNLFGDPALNVGAPPGPRPPTSQNSEAGTPVNEPMSITLLAGDDGLPDPPGALTYIVTALPAYGTLSEPGGGDISAAPHVLAAGGNAVVYTPDMWYAGPDAFTFESDDGGVPPDGGRSNEATVSITVGVPEPVYVYDFDEDPQWDCDGQWAFGQPTGGGSYGGDPTSGYSGPNVYGYNLSGDYPNYLPQHFLTMPPLDCSELTDTSLRFRRWLGVESSSWDHASVDVSIDGVQWTTIWENEGSNLSETSWSYQLYDISDIADGQSAVHIRWCMGTTDSIIAYPGWNLDDVEIWGVVPAMAPCDTVADCADLDIDGLRDDPCVWWACTAGACDGESINFSDLGGEYGACRPDGVADSHDRFHAINCFANVDTLGAPGYPCETQPPTALNVDAGGEFGACIPDGVCDANDAFHAIAAFDGTSLCTCPPGPAPLPPGNAQPSARVTLHLVPRTAQVRPGDTVAVDLFLDQALDDLRGYQLHLDAGGPSLRLIDLVVEERPNHVFNGEAQWRAFNLDTAQLAVGKEGPGVATAAGAYLATAVYRVEPAAAERMTVDLRHGQPVADNRTFLFATLLTERIDIMGTTAASLRVDAITSAKDLRRAARD